MVWGRPAFFLFTWLCCISTAWGQSFQTKFYKQVIPHFATGKTGALVGEGKIGLHYRSFPVASSDKAIVIVAGYSENAEKYAELIYDLNTEGYSVYILDHRGMGRSGRELKNRQIVHVKNFDDYVKDQSTFFRLVVNKGPEKNRFIFAHSTGGLIAAKLLAKEKSLAKAAIFSSPLFELNTGNYGRWAAGTVATSLDWFGQGENYAPGFSNFNPRTAKMTATSSCSDPERFAAYNRLLIANPTLVMGGPSVHWVREVLKETKIDRIRNLGKAISLPILVYQAGNDSLVLPQGQSAFCGSAKNCKIRRYAKAHHEIWREGDRVRNDAIQRMIQFFNE